MTEGVYDPNLGVVRYDITEATIPTQQLLRDASKSKSAPHNETLLAFMKLSGTAPAKLEADQVKVLQAALRQHIGDGVPDGTAERNRKSREDYPAKNKHSLDDLRKQLKKDGFSESFQDKCIDVFERAVGKHSAKMALVEMLTDSPHLRLLMQEAEAIDASEFLANHIIELEESIAIVEAENAMLISEAKHRHSALHEEAVFAQPKQQTWRRSSRNLQDDLEGVDPSNAVLMEAGGPRRHHADAKMNARAVYLTQTMQNTDVVPDKQYLVETWSKIEN
jgi:hypothetical protein